MLYLVGLALVAAAVWMFFFQAGIDQWIPVSLAVVAILLIVGVGLMRGADVADDDATHHDTETVVERRRYG